MMPNGEILKMIKEHADVVATICECDEIDIINFVDDLESSLKRAEVNEEEIANIIFTTAKFQQEKGCINSRELAQAIHALLKTRKDK